MYAFWFVCFIMRWAFLWFDSSGFYSQWIKKTVWISKFGPIQLDFVSHKLIRLAWWKIGFLKQPERVQVDSNLIKINTSPTLTNFVFQILKRLHLMLRSQLEFQAKELCCKRRLVINWFSRSRNFVWGTEQCSRNWHNMVKMHCSAINYVR